MDEHTPKYLPGFEPNDIKPLVVKHNTKKIISNPSTNNEKKQKQGKKKILVIGIKSVPETLKPGRFLIVAA